MDKLQDIFDLQEGFASKFTDFKNLSEKERQDWAVEYIGHTIEELIELRREIPRRKHWKRDREELVDMPKALDEYVDVLHFFVNIALVFDWTADDIYEAYLKKNQVNHDRQKSGY